MPFIVLRWSGGARRARSFGRILGGLILAGAAAGAPGASAQLAPVVAAPASAAPITAPPVGGAPVATAPVAPARAAATPARTNGYRISAGDELDVFVWGEERMQRQVRVTPDGSFAFPLAGTISAVGRTVDDVSAEIRERISVNYRSAPPDVTVSVRDATGLRFFVIGKVRTPGSYTSGRAVDIVQALSMAGGLAEFADVKNAVILRQMGDRQVVEPAKLSRVLKGGKSLSAGALADPLPMMRSGDVLVVP